MIKAVIFDYDGVIVHSLPAGMEVYREIARHFNVKEVENIEKFKELHLNGYHDVLAHIGVSDFELVKKIYQETTKKLKDTIWLVDGIKELLAKFSEKYKLGLASSTYSNLINERLQAHDIKSYFSVVICREDVPNPKPAPDALIRCAEKLGVPVKEALYVGDMVIDIKAGKAAGMKTVIITGCSWNHRKHIMENEPDLIIEKPEGLLKIL